MRRVQSELVIVKKKGFGFCQVDGTRTFIHISEFETRIKEMPACGAVLEFDLAPSEKIEGQYTAKRITIISEPKRPEKVEKTQKKKGKSTKKKYPKGHEINHKFKASDVRKIVKNTGNQGKENLARWLDSPELKLDDYNESHLLDGHSSEYLGNGKRFSGWFVTWLHFPGWQSHIWCPEISKFVYCCHDKSHSSGSIVPYSKVEFNVILALDNRNELQFQAVNWDSEGYRNLPEKLDTFDLGSIEKMESIQTILNRNIPFICIDSEGNKIKIRGLKKYHDGFEIEEIPWPNRGHPFIKKYVEKAWQVYPKNAEKIYNGSKPSEALEYAITELAHLSMIRYRQPNEWIILGDETGNLKEFEDLAGHRKSRMMWTVVPPSVSELTLQPLSPGFHGSDIELYNPEMDSALKSLESNMDVMKFVFTYSSGKIQQNLTDEHSQSPHLKMWQDTLPLVMEKVAEMVEDDAKITILIERVNPYGPGSEPLATMMQDFAQMAENRSSFKDMKFDATIVRKNPAEHGWMGYTDALGHIFNENISDEMVNVVTSLRKNTFEAPFDAGRLHILKSILMKAGTGLDFLNSLYELDIIALRDYREFLGASIIESLSQLTESDWQDLLNQIQIRAEKQSGQQVTSVILEYVDEQKITMKFSHPDTKFDVLLAILGTSNHIGAIELSSRCVIYLKQMIDEGFVPKPDRRMKMSNLQGGSRDNIFDFEGRLQDVLALPEERMSDEQIRYFGSVAVAHALEGTYSSIEIAWKIEERLLSEVSDVSNRRRRLIYRSELLMQKGELDDAHQVLHVDLPDTGTDWMDGYSLSAILKLKVLKGELPTKDDENIINLIPDYLNNRHPSQRVAYWAIRWLANSNRETAELCKNHILTLVDVPLFHHDAPGVILACELLDLNDRQLIEFDAEKYFQTVISSSSLSTQSWVMEHWPEVGDRLSPLKFNYA